MAAAWAVMMSGLFDTSKKENERAMCEQCDGTGKWYNAKRTASIECRACKGTGGKKSEKRDMVKCERCDGSGRIFDINRDSSIICRTCQGVGKRFR